MNKPSNNRQSGQVLLIIVMILTTILAVTFSISFTSQTDTQTSKLEEASKQSLAATESILEASLKNNVGTYTLSNLGLNNLSGFTGSATVAETTGTVFTTPLLQKDEQYTFYLSQYPGFSSPFSGNVYLYLQSETNCPTVELTYIHTDNSLTRDLIDPCNQITGSGKLNTQTGSLLNGINFSYKTSAPIALSNMKLVLMRVLFYSTKLGVQEITGGSNLPSQGKITTAQAQTNTSVASTVKLFQSYPQIPADFFVTSF